MKVLFIEAKKKFQKPLIRKLEGLPKQIHLLYTIQYKELAEELRKELEKKHKVLGFDQVIGCSDIKLKASPLLVGSGKFHALQLADSGKEIYIYDEGKISKIGKKEIENIKKREKGKLSKFLASENIGLLVSKKLGQNKIKEARNLKEKLEKKYGKKFYMFLADTINLQELENFNVDFFVNFACPGIGLDKDVINYKKLIEK